MVCIGSGKLLWQLCITLLPFLYSWVCAQGTQVYLGACLYSSLATHLLSPHPVFCSRSTRTSTGRCCARRECWSGLPGGRSGSTSRHGSPRSCRRPLHPANSLFHSMALCPHRGLMRKKVPLPATPENREFKKK